MSYSPLLFPRLEDGRLLDGALLVFQRFKGFKPTEQLCFFDYYPRETLPFGCLLLSNTSDEPPKVYLKMVF